MASRCSSSWSGGSARRKSWARRSSCPPAWRLAPGLGIQVDERPRHSYPFEICNPTHCQARAILQRDLLSDLKAGLTGHVKFQYAAAPVPDVPVSLKGFSAVLRALP